jgi:hypothetical protein
LQKSDECVSLLRWCFPAVLAASAVQADAQAVIKVNDDLDFRLGALGQFWGHPITEPEAGASIATRA